MKNVLRALALVAFGTVSLAASANAMPAVSSIAGIGEQTTASVEQVGFYHHKRRHHGHRHWHGHHYYGYKHYGYGHGFSWRKYCYYKPWHPKCHYYNY